MGSIVSKRARKRPSFCRKEDCSSKEEPYENNVGFSDRSDVPIEPRLSEQWFLRYPKTEEALAVVREHLIRFLSSALGKGLCAMAGEHSGLVHQPAGLVGASDPGLVSKAWNREQKREKQRFTSVSSRLRMRKTGCRIPTRSTPGFHRGSGLTKRWTRKRGRSFIRPSILVTGPDIIFFWVARMIMAGLEFNPARSERDEDNIPFHDVFFTGIIRDKQGRKM